MRSFRGVGTRSDSTRAAGKKKQLSLGCARQKWEEQNAKNEGKVKSGGRRRTERFAFREAKKQSLRPRSGEIPREG